MPALLTLIGKHVHITNCFMYTCATAAAAAAQVSATYSHLTHCHTQVQEDRSRYCKLSVRITRTL